MPKSTLNRKLSLPHLGYLLPPAIGLLGLSLSIFAWHHLRANDQRALTVEASATARHASHSLRARLETQLQALDRMAQEYGANLSEASGELAMDRLAQDSPGISAIARLDQEGKIIKASQKPNADSILATNGHDRMLPLVLRPALLEARSLKARPAQRRMKPFTGGLLWMAPLSRSSRPNGFLLAAFDLTALAAALEPHPGYRLSLSRPGGDLLFRQATKGEWADIARAEATLLLGDQSFVVTATPSIATVRAHHTITPWAGAVLTALFSTILAALVGTICARRTAEMHARQDLKERLDAEKKFQLLFENSTDAQFLVDDEGIVDCNPSTVRILGAKSKEEIIGCHPARFSPLKQPDGSPSVPQTELIKEEIQQKGCSRFEWTHCRLDGSTFRAEVTVIALEIEGRPVQLVSWHDLSERFAAEEKFRVLFQHSNDAHLLISEQGLLECNPATLALYRASQLQDIRGKSALAFGVSSTEEFTRFEQSQRRLDGTDFPALITLKQVSYRGETAYLATVQDLTDQKNTQAKLLESSKMSSLGEMASGMAHELNTPLAVIKAKGDYLSALAAVKPVSPEDLAKHLEVVDKMVNRMATIIRSLRFFARDSGRDTPSRVSADTIIEETLTLCRARFAENGIELTVAGDRSAEILCRPVQISQILLNLVSNAFDAVSSQELRKVSIEVKASGSTLLFIVEDSGPGVPEALRAKIMQPFFTTKDIGKGTGLGLSISTGLASSNGGRLYLEPSGPTTRFVLELPLGAAALKQAS